MKTKIIYGAAAAGLVLFMSGGGYALYMAGMKHGSDSPRPQGTASSPMPAAPAPADMSSVAAGEEATRRHIKNGLKAGDIDPANGQQVL